MENASATARDHEREAAFDAEWRQALTSELKDAVTVASRQVMETARVQAAEVVKRAQDVAKAQSAEFINQANEHARNQAAEIVAQAKEDARTQTTELVKQAQQVAQAQAARIIARAEEDARVATDAAAGELARKTKELARLEREYRLRIVQAAPIPRSKPESRKAIASARIATAKPTLRPGWKVDLGKDRQAIERAITDHYFVSNNWGEIHQIQNIRFHEIRGDQVEMTVEYLVTSMSTAGWRGFAKRSLQGRFLLRKEGGSFLVLRMWDTKESDLRAASERKSEGRAPAISTARKQDAGAAKTSPESAPATTTSPSGRTIDYAKDRTAIEQAIRDYYDFARHSNEIRLAPHLKYTYWGLEIDEINRVTVKNIRGNEVDVSAEYVASSTFSLWTGKLYRKSRFLLRKDDGSFFVIKMWDDEENSLRARSDQKPESHAPAMSTARKHDAERSKSNPESAPAVATSLPHSTINYAKDRAEIELAISDYYFLTGHLDEDAEFANDIYYGSEIVDFHSVAVQKIDGNEVDVLVEYLAAADSNYGAVSLKRKSRFLLRKNKASFTVLKMWSAGSV